MIEPDPPMMQRMFKEPAGVVLYAENVMLFIPLTGEQVMKLTIAEVKDQLQGNVITAGIPKEPLTPKSTDEKEKETSS